MNIMNLNEFANMPYSNFLQPCITEQTRLMKKQKPILTDTIFVNFFNKKMIGDNVFDKIPDHLPEVVVIKDINNKETKEKKKDLKNFNHDKYLEDLKEIEKLNLLQYKNVYQGKLIYIIDKHAPYRILSKKEQKLKIKLWINKSILNSFRKKN